MFIYGGFPHPWLFHSSWSSPPLPRQEDCHEVQASLDYSMSHFLRKQTLKVLGLDL